VSAPEQSGGRVQKRVAVGLAMQVSGKEVDGMPFDDTVYSGNVSRTGASFLTQRRLEVGMEVDVLIPRRPGDPHDADFASRAQVVRAQPGADEREILVGVQFLDRRFHRVYVSESTS
jgi:hypothetical protein